jgi:hypothetical protein
MNHHHNDHQVDQTIDQKQYTVSNFLPLIIIVACIVLLTLLKSLFLQTWDFHSLMYDFMAFFFLVFGFFKIINLKNFAQAYAMYDLLAQRSSLYGFIYPFIELTLGICYLMRWFLLTTNSVTVIIMLVSAAGVFNELRKGKTIVCACLGTVFKIPMTYVTLAEDLLMAAMAFLMLFI